MLAVALICYIPHVALSLVCVVLFLTVLLPPKAPPHPCTSLACLLSSCRLSCIRSPSRLLQWPLQPQLATMDISQALLHQTPQMEKHQLFLHLPKPESSSPDPPLPHGFLRLLAPGQLPSTCMHQRHPPPANSLHRFGVIADVVVPLALTGFVDMSVCIVALIGCYKLSQCLH